jgi:glycosyltransferase involved in cell wall biosynthesis
MLHNPKQSDNGNKRLLLVGNFLSQTIKVRHVCEDLAESLRAAGWLVYASSRQRGRLHRLLDMVATIYRRRKQYQVALVEVYSGLSFLWAEATGMTLTLLGKPYVLTLHGGGLPAFSQRWPGRVRRLLQSAARVTTPSTYLLKEMPQVRPDVQVIPNGLDLSQYQYLLRSHPQPRLIWLRALAHIYNPSLAIKTLALLASGIPSIKLDLIGPDKGDGSLEQVRNLADRLRVQNHLRVVGGIPKSDVPRWLNEGDIFINTTNYESFGVSVMEAAASGLCIVTTDVGELRYLWEDGQDALLVPPDDPEAMAAAVRRILTEPGLAQRLSESARKKAEQFDWSVILPQWEALLAAVAQSRRPCP